MRLSNGDYVSANMGDNGKIYLSVLDGVSSDTAAISLTPSEVKELIKLLQPGE